MTKNIDELVVADFGYEWNHFDQSEISPDELNKLFESYFKVFPWKQLPEKSEGFDLGCGSGRWAKLVAERVHQLHCIDPSSAIEVARRNLAERTNCRFYQADVDNIPLEDNSMDFGYSLGVLHHIPNTSEGIKSCVRKLKPEAPFLLYLYYDFDNKPKWFRAIWKASEYLRTRISKLPSSLKQKVCNLIAVFLYFPVARTAKLFEAMGFRVENFPLSFYRNRSLYTMKTDALDRFGTRLEHRFSRAEIKQMMEESGLKEIVFSDEMPFWCAIGFKADK